MRPRTLPSVFAPDIELARSGALSSPADLVDKPGNGSPMII